MVPLLPMEAVLAEPDLSRLRRFIGAIADLVSRADDETVLIAEGRALLADLVAVDDWLPEAFAQPHPDRYTQHLLHCDSAQRFSIVSFVWGPGQVTPVHDHTVWGLIGMLRGEELSQPFVRDAGGLRPQGPAHRLRPGDVEAVSPTIGDIHRVSNAFDDRVSISIHVYGGNIGAIRRSTFDETGAAKPFVSGYSNTLLPNLWDLSKEPHA